MHTARWPLALVTAIACRGSDDDGAPVSSSSSDTAVASATATRGSDTGASDDGTGMSDLTGSTSTGREDSSDSGPLSTSGGPDAAFTITKTGTTFIATSTADPRFGVEIDCDDEATDGRYFGVTPVIDGQGLEVQMYGGPHFPLFTPDFDAGTSACVQVESDDVRLLVRLETGSYQALDPAATDQPVPLDVEFTIEGDRMVARTAGIYYMMLTRADTDLTITHGQVDMRTIDAATPAFTENFDDVTHLVAADSIYGPLEIDGDIARLQVQLYDDGSEGFELDLDHAFKDLGQTSVTLTVAFG